MIDFSVLKNIWGDMAASNMTIFRGTLILLTVFLCLITSVNAKERVSLYTYFDKAPFIIDKDNKRGLSFDLARKLTEHSSLFRFEVVYLPKQRAIERLDKRGAMLWINPLWVGDKSQTKYDWISDIINDSELYVSPDSELKYKGIESLYNKTMVGVRGYNYVNLDDAVAQGKIRRFDVTQESLIVDFLMKKRADFGVIGAQTFAYFQRNLVSTGSKLHIVSGYHNPFTRSILVSKADARLKQELQSWFATTEWQSLQQKWLDISINQTP